MFRKQRAPHLCCAGIAVVLVAVGLLGACRRDAPPPPAQAARGPAAAVLRLVHDLRRDDLAGYARHAVPPALHARLDAAWREDRSRWPLTQLPLDTRLPGMLTTLAAPEAERTVLATYNRQFAGAEDELRTAAATVGQFAVQYVQREGHYSDEERDHYTQLVGALVQWGQRAPLADGRRARAAIPQLVSAARLTGLADPRRYAQLGMDRSLRRLGPFFVRLKRVLHGYGLDLDAALDSVQVDLAEQTGETARVRLRYTVAGRQIDAYLRMERIGGRWYLSDAVRHARAQADAPALAAAAMPAAPTPAPAPATTATAATTAAAAAATATTATATATAATATAATAATTTTATTATTATAATTTTTTTTTVAPPAMPPAAPARRAR